MKIGSSSPGLRYTPTIKEKSENPDTGGSGHQGGSYDPEGQKKRQNPATSEKVGQAVEAFQSDAQTKANGLNASIEGEGPGLRVILKDGAGSVIRQFTGEEFLKLRESAKEGRQSGKILDRKL